MTTNYTGLSIARTPMSSTSILSRPTGPREILTMFAIALAAMTRKEEQKDTTMREEAMESTYVSGWVMEDCWLPRFGHHFEWKRKSISSIINLNRFIYHSRFEPVHPKFGHHRPTTRWQSSTWCITAWDIVKSQTCREERDTGNEMQRFHQREKETTKMENCWNGNWRDLKRSKLGPRYDLWPDLGDGLD